MARKKRLLDFLLPTRSHEVERQTTSSVPLDGRSTSFNLLYNYSKFLVENNIAKQGYDYNVLIKNFLECEKEREGKGNV
jgi:hypothetical protein